MRTPKFVYAATTLVIAVCTLSGFSATAQAGTTSGDCTKDFKVFTVRGSGTGNAPVDAESQRKDNKNNLINWDIPESQSGNIPTGTYYKFTQELRTEARSRNGGVDPIDPVVTPVYEAVVGGSRKVYPAVGAVGGNIADIANYAVPFWRYVPGVETYDESVRDGKLVLAQMVNADLARCASNPNRKAIIIGHSQGAAVAADTYQDGGFGANSSRVLLALVGDPRLNASDPVVRQGVMPVSRPMENGMDPDTRDSFDPASHGRIVSVCHDDDPVCNGLITEGKDMRNHGNYIGFPYADEARRRANFDGIDSLKDTLGDMQSITWSQDEAKMVARELMSKNMPRKAADAAAQAPIDLVFVIDITKSMDQYMGLVKADARYFVDEMKAKSGNNLRVGFAAYGDDGMVDEKGQPYWYKRILQPTNDWDLVKSTIDSWKTAINKKNNETPEGMYQAVRKAAGGLGVATGEATDWRPDAKHIEVVMTDAGNNVRINWNDETVESIQSRLSQNRVIVAGKVYGYDQQAYRDLLPLASATGGVIIGDSPNLTYRSKSSATPRETTGNNSLLNILQAVSAAPPVADAGGVYTFYMGGLAYVSAQNSYDADGHIVRYQWDLNGDGRFDCDSDFDVRCKVDTSREGSREVRLRITNDLGAVAESKSTVSVVRSPSGATSRPAMPPTPTVVPLPGAVEVVPTAASPVKGFVVSYTDSAGKKSAVSVSVDATGMVPSSRVLIPLDAPTSVSVRAVNELGYSDPATVLASPLPVLTSKKKPAIAGITVKGKSFKATATSLVPLVAVSWDSGLIPVKRFVGAKGRQVTLGRWFVSQRSGVAYAPVDSLRQSVFAPAVRAPRGFKSCVRFSVVDFARQSASVIRCR